MNVDKVSEKQMRPTTKEELYQMINESDEFTIGSLLAIYKFQTPGEQATHTTREQNEMGFNMVDAHVMSSMAEFYHRAGFLTPKQLAFVKREIKKYHGQLLSVGVEPAPIKSREPKLQIETKMWASLVNDGKDILAKFQFPKGDRRFVETLNVVKAIPGRRWNKEKVGWEIVLSIGAYEILRDHGFEMADKLTEWYQKMTAPVNGEINIPGLKMDLYPFQKSGVAFIESREGRALVADEMGLGKTAQALAWLQLNREEALPALAVVPASVKINWQRECKKWTDIPVTILSGRNGNGSIRIPGLTIINYDVLEAWLPTLKKVGFKTLILDEVHYTKNSQAKRTQAVKKLAASIDHVIALSGTPIINRPIEFFNCLHMLRRDLFPSYHHYGKKYCGAKVNEWATRAMARKGKPITIMDYSGSSNIQELHEILTKTIMVRRLKSEVLTELPPKVRTVLPLEFNRSEYEKAEAEFASWVRGEFDIDAFLDGMEWEDERPKRQKAEALVRIEKLKQAAAKGKMEAAISWIEDYLGTGEKLVVFATHHKVIDELVNHFSAVRSDTQATVGVVKLDGRDSQSQKQAAVDAFQTDPAVKLFVGNIKAAGVGITLHAAPATCFVELGWTPGEHDQAEDRIHRIGQEADSVSAYYLVAERTIEEEITALLDKKREVLDMVLDGKEVEQESLLTELLKRYKEVDNEEAV